MPRRTPAGQAGGPPEPRPGDPFLVATFLYRMGRTAFQRRWLVTLLWAVILGAVGFGAARAPAASDNGTSFMPGIEAQKAFDLIGERFPGSDANGAGARIVFVAPDGEKVIAAGHRAAIDTLVTEAGDDPRPARCRWPRRSRPPRAAHRRHGRGDQHGLDHGPRQHLRAVPDDRDARDDAGTGGRHRLRPVRGLPLPGGTRGRPRTARGDRPRRRHGRFRRGLRRPHRRHRAGGPVGGRRSDADQDGPVRRGRRGRRRRRSPRRRRSRRRSSRRRSSRRSRRARSLRPLPTRRNAFVKTRQSRV